MLIGGSKLQGSGSLPQIDGLCLHTCFAAVAAETPDAIAAVAGEQSVTYEQLNRRANRLAHKLRDIGVDREVLVALYVDRSLGMLVSIFGVLKAGGAYVPIDSVYPTERVGFMLQDAQIQVLITEKRLLKQLPPHNATVICVDEEVDDAGDGCDKPPENYATPQNLAYVIYTSGSTGIPKGVQITHASVLSLFEATRPLIESDWADIWSAFHSYAFDLSVWEIFGCLLSGGRLIIVSREMTQSPGDFCSLLRREKVTILNQTPSALRQLTFARRRQILEGAADLSLRLVVSGGEALPPDLGLDVLEWPVVLWNFYGPTEATVWATAGQVERKHCCGGFVNIGRPLANSEIYVLDKSGDALPPGETGELCIAGRSLARGYLNRSELTNTRFTTKTAEGQPPKRIYRTGDLGCYQPDATLEFHGRVDEQVKIRGFRVEPGEIEAALRRHPGVRDCVIVARETGSGDKRLIAYVVTTDDAPASTAFRDFLKNILPDYMVPSAYVFLDALPLSTNGKVDRFRLPAPCFASRGLTEAAVRPADDLEVQLVKIWRKILGLHCISVKDSFFDLGGDSMLAVQLFCEIEKTCGKYLPLVTLLHAHTIEKLAQAIRVADAFSVSGSSLVPFQPAGEKPPLFCIHPIGGTVFGFKDLVPLLDPSQPVYGLQSRGVDKEHAPLTRVEEMASHYIAQIRTVQPKGPYYFVGLCFGALVGFEMSRQLLAAGQKVALLCMLDPDGPGTGTSEIPFFARASIRLSAVRRLARGGGIPYLAERLRNFHAKTEQFLWKRGMQICAFAGARTPRILWNAERANYEAVARYSPCPIDCPMTIFRALERPIFEDVAQLEWRKFAAGHFEVHEVPGSHLTMMREPHVEMVASRLNLCLLKISSANRL